MATARKAKPRTKPAPGPQIDATSVSSSMVPYGEQASRRVSMQDQPRTELVVRALVGTAAAASQLTASVCASQRLRVYRPVRSRSKVWQGRPVSKALRAYLTGEGKQLPGVKTMLAASQAGDFEEVLDCPFMQLMRDPDPQLTGMSWIRAMYWMHEMTGAAFAAVERYGSQDPVALWWLPSQYVTIVPSRAKMIGSFVFGRNSGDRMEVPPESMQYIRALPHPVRPWEAWSWVRQCATELDCEAAAIESEMRRWLNGGQPGQVYEVDPTASKDQYEAIKATNSQGMSGVFNAGKAQYLWRVKLIQSDFKPMEMGYVEGMDRIKATVYQHAQIPETIWKLSESNRASAAAGNPQYASLTILPRISLFSAYFTENLLPMFAGTEGWFCAYDNPVPEDEVAQSDRAVKLYSGGVIKRNEARAMAGIEADPTPAGDQYAAPAGPMLIGGVMPQTGKPGETPQAQADAKPQDAQIPASDSNTAAATGDVQAAALNGAQVQALVELVTQVADGKMPRASAEAIARASFPTVAPDVLAGIFSPLDGFKPTQETSNADMAGRGGSNRGDAGTGVDGGEADSDSDSGDQADASAGAAGKRHTAGNGRTDGKDAGTGTDASRVSPVVDRRASLVGQAGNPTEDDGDSRKRLTLGKSGWWFAGHDHGVKDDRASNLPADAERVITTMSGKLRSWFDSIAKDVRVNADGTIDLGKHAAEFDALLSQELAAAMIAGGQAMGEQLDSAFSVTNEQALELLSNYRISLATEVTGTIETDINDALRAAIGEGRTASEASAEIADALGQQADYRSERIARSEVSHLSNRGANVAMKEAGIEECEWLLAGGPCLLCESAFGSRPKAKVGEPFWRRGETIPGTDHTITFREVYGGDLHPNCRCGVAPIIATED